MRESKDTFSGLNRQSNLKRLSRRQSRFIFIFHKQHEGVADMEDRQSSNNRGSIDRHGPIEMTCIMSQRRAVVWLQQKSP